MWIDLKENKDFFSSDLLSLWNDRPLCNPIVCASPLSSLWGKRVEKATLFISVKRGLSEYGHCLPLFVFGIHVRGKLEYEYDRMQL